MTLSSAIFSLGSITNVNNYIRNLDCEDSDCFSAVLPFGLPPLSSSAQLWLPVHSSIYCCLQHFPLVTKPVSVVWCIHTENGRCVKSHLPPLF